jgi:hypothetical protein
MGVPCVGQVVLHKRLSAVYCLILSNEAIDWRQYFVKNNLTYARHTQNKRPKATNNKTRFCRCRVRVRVWVRVRVRVWVRVRVRSRVRVRVRVRVRMRVGIRLRVRERQGAWPFLRSFPKQPKFCGRPPLATLRVLPHPELEGGKSAEVSECKR